MSNAAPVMTFVPAPYRGKVLARGNQLIALTLFVFQVVLSIAVSAVPALLGALLALSGKVFPNDKNLSFLPILVGLGLTGGLAWLVVGYALRYPWTSWYMFRKMQSEFLRRPDPIVDPRNPDAILAEVMPRRNWGDVGLGGTEDMGLIFVDAQRHEILFEGDNKRYRIPAAAFLSAEVEMVNPDWEGEPGSAPVAVVTVKYRESGALGEREIPFRPMRAVSGDPLGTHYVERARELCRRLLRINAVPEHALAR